MSSLVVFSVNVRRVALFYETVLGAHGTPEPSGDIRLLTERDEVLIHSVPEQFAEGIKIGAPPEPREGSPFKPVFDVVSLARAVAGAEATGGAVFGKGFVADGLARRDVVDPDGNIIQLRSQDT